MPPYRISKKSNINELFLLLFLLVVGIHLVNESNSLRSHAQSKKHQQKIDFGFGQNNKQDQNHHAQ